MGCGASVSQVPTGPPYWCSSLYIDPEMAGGFNAVSEGMSNVSSYHVIRERKGNSVTDAARWNKAMSSGKHVFEVIWPAKNNKGTHSCIGVATTAVPLSKQGKFSLVGAHSQGWGLDLSRRRVIHSDQVVKVVPHGMPDKFFMYVDMDAGKIGFGEDLAWLGQKAVYYGDLIANIRVSEENPVYVMVSCLGWKENIQVNYKGTACHSGGFDLVTSVLPPPVVPVDPKATLMPHTVPPAPVQAYAVAGPTAPPQEPVKE